MAKRIDPDELELRALARGARAVAAQAGALADLEEDAPRYIDSSPVLALVAADTVVFENYRDPQLCLAWLSQALRAWLRANARFNQRGERSLVYRYVVLPYPSLLQNWAKRSALIDTILLNLHLHLWHGVICCVFFADPRRVPSVDVARVLNFLAIPAYGLLYDLPSFYRSDTIQSDLLDGSKARDRLKEISVFVRRLGQASWLYYDDANFNGPRLTGSRWGTLRTFFRRLYGPTLTCIGCGRAVGAYALDHIAPVSRGYFQTLINFRPLCRSCNSAKGNLLGEDPYRPRIFIPRELPTDGLDIIYTSVPPWLGSIQRPGSERDLLRPDIGHD